MQHYLGQVMLVGLGGFLGSGARFVLSGATQRLFAGGFPYGTLLVNVLGCLAIGCLAGLIELRQIMSPGQRTFLLAGILGGFTTFSTFAIETLGMAQGSELARAGINIVGHVVLGILAAWLGYQIAQNL